MTPHTVSLHRNAQQIGPQHRTRPPSIATSRAYAASIAARPRTPLPLRPVRTAPPPTPFTGAEQAWFWTAGALAARRDGVRSSGPRIPRPCEPDDVIRALDLLYRCQGIGLDHARALRRWGDRGMAPDPRLPAERADALLWAEALDRLDEILRVKGLLAPLTKKEENNP